MKRTSRKLTPSWLTGPRRKRLYRVGGAVTVLLITYGLLSTEQAAAWVGLAGAILLPTLAQDNTPPV